MFKTLGKLAVVVAAAASFGGAQAQVTNGSFEDPTLISGGSKLFSDGINGWGYGAGTELVHQGDFGVTAQDGTQYAQLTNPGEEIYTTLTTTIGSGYLLSYYTFGNGTVSANDSYGQQPLLNQTSFTTDWSGWTLGTLLFTAVSDSTKIYFDAIAPGTLIDNVSVSAVPETETYAMLIAGLGVLGFVGRRRLGRQD